MVTWIVEPDTFAEQNPEKIIEAANALGHKAQWHKHIPFVDYFDLEIDGPVIYYGSINGVKLVPADWKWADFSKLRCSYYYPRAAKHLTQQEYFFLPMSEVVRRKSWVYEVMSDQPKLANDRFSNKYYQKTNPQVFIRPDDNTKSFNGGLVAYNSFDRWLEQSQLYNETINDMIIVARPRMIIKESRFVVAENKVITGSQYKPLTDGYAPKAKECVERFLAECNYRPASVFVVDVAETIDGEHSILEFGAFNCAGLYRCEIGPIVETLSAIAEKEYDP